MNLVPSLRDWTLYHNNAGKISINLYKIAPGFIKNIIGYSAGSGTPNPVEVGHQSD